MYRAVDDLSAVIYEDQVRISAHELCYEPKGLGIVEFIGHGGRYLDDTLVTGINDRYYL